MRKVLSVLVCFVLIFVLSSCTKESDLYGAWYVDSGDIRNAIQFSENDNGDNIFIWVVYNLEKDSIESNDSGKYHIYGNSITLEYNGDIDPITLDFELVDNKLTLSSETARLILEKYELENQ